MRKWLLPLGLLAVLAFVGAWVTLAGGAEPAAWHRAIQVPGLAALVADRSTHMGPVSCPTGGNCAAGGDYLDGSGNQQAFVVDETNGSWGNAVEVPGIAALNTGGAAGVNSVSCATAGNCVAAGFYTDQAGSQAFVVDETDGRWGTAIQVPGTTSLSTGTFFEKVIVNAVSCATAGNCTAGGSYTNRAGSQAFVAEERNGRWGTAIEVPGTARLNSGGDASVRAVSCGAAGNCTAVGTYADSSAPDYSQAFVVDERNGNWGTAIEVPGTATLNSGGTTDVSSVSCATAGNCIAVGTYGTECSTSTSFRSRGRIDCVNYQAFVVDETKAGWGDAVAVSGTVERNAGNRAGTNSVSCATPGNCAAGGYYTDDSYRRQAFVVDETNGSWGTAIDVPGMATRNSGDAYVSSVSCPTAGNCTAGGSYADASGGLHAFVVEETNGSWGKAIEVPGTATLNSGGYASVNSVSCATPDDCAASGAYTDGSRPTDTGSFGSGRYWRFHRLNRAFVVSFR